MIRKITEETLTAYIEYLRTEERSAATVEKYRRDVGAFTIWIQEKEVTKEAAWGWKEYLVKEGYAAVTINAMLSALNGYFRFMGWEDCRVKFLRVQRRMFRDASRDLDAKEYHRLVETAFSLGKERLGLLMETIGGTGLRVSEVQYITVEAAQAGCAEISLKGKIRTILLPGKLSRKLLKYAKKQKIASGEIFLTGSGKSLSRRQIWAEMKQLCKSAGVAASKVFPHNLRHLFARTFYRTCRDIVQLADILGHSSVETTRIYLISTGVEHAHTLNRLGLVC